MNREKTWMPGTSSGEPYTIDEDYGISPQSDGYYYTRTTTSYLYDKANRMTMYTEDFYETSSEEVETRSLKKVRCVYDDAGNQISTVAEFLTDDTSSSSNETIDVGYDSVVEVSINEYNGLNQLINTTNIKDGTRTFASYVYNGDGLRVQKTVDGETTDYIYSGGYVIAETGRTYLYGMSYHAVTENEETYYYFCNAHGDVTSVVDSGGETAAAYDYDEFGNTIAETGTFESEIRYAGEFFDGESENYYLRARYYDPSAGRFTSKDPHWNPDNMIYGDTTESSPKGDIRGADYKLYIPQRVVHTEEPFPTPNGEDSGTKDYMAHSLIEETSAFSSGVRYTGDIYADFFAGEGVPPEASLFAEIVLRNADISAIKQAVNLYVYCANNPVVFVDPWGLESYVFYLSQWENRAQQCKQELMSMGIDENEIILVPLNSEEDFENGWNSMGTLIDADGDETSVDIDHVIIDTHANPKAIGTTNDWKLRLNEIDKLEEKDIKGNVVLLGCNAGHLDYKDDNVASHFAQKTNGALVIASDGTVSSKVNKISAKGDDGVQIQTPNGYYKSVYLKDRNGYVDPFEESLINGQRDNKGWIVYHYNGSTVTTRVADSGSKVLTISGACRLIY